MTRRTLPQPGSIGLTAYEQRLADDLKRALDRVSDLETALHIADAMREKHLTNLRACMEKRDAAEARIAELETQIPETWIEATRDAICDFLTSDSIEEKYWKHASALEEVADQIRSMSVTADVSAKLAARAATAKGEGK